MMDRMMNLVNIDRALGDGENIRDRWVSQLLNRKREPDQPPLAPAVWKMLARIDRYHRVGHEEFCGRSDFSEVSNEFCTKQTGHPIDRECRENVKRCSYRSGP